MKKFSQYLMENKRYYDFRIKIVGDLPEKFDRQLRDNLEKYSCVSMDKSTTPVQKLPLDFPDHKNETVHIYEVSLEYPTITPVLKNHVRETMNIADSRIVVRTDKEPLEEYQKMMGDRDNVATHSKNDIYLVKLGSDINDDPATVNGQKMVGTAHAFELLKELSKEKHEMEIVPADNLEFYAKSVPNASGMKEQSNKDADSKSPFANRKMPNPKGMR